MGAVSVHLAKVAGMFVPTNIKVHDGIVAGQTSTEEISQSRFRLTQS